MALIGQGIDLGQRKAAFRSGNFEIDPDSWMSQGLVGWWALQDTKDRSRYKSHLSDSASQVVIDHPRLHGIRAREFNGSSQWLDTFSIGHLGSLAEGTVCYWARYTDFSGQAIVMGDTDGTSYYVIGSNSSTIGFRYQKNGVDQLQASIIPSTSTNTWYFVAFTVRSSGNIMYLDGVNVGRSYSNGSSATSLFYSDNSGAWDNLSIGRRNSHSSPGGYFNGVLNDVRIYNRALSDAEVYELYTNPEFLVKPLQDTMLQFPVAVAAPTQVPVFHPF